MKLPEVLRQALKHSEPEQGRFDEWLEGVREIDHQVFELFGDKHAAALRSTEGREDKKSLMALHALMCQLAFIKNGVIEECEQDNLYAAKILYRSYLEHWLKSQYIFVRYVKEKDSAIGEEYFNLCMLEESAKYGNSLKALAEILGAERSNEDPWDLILKRKPELLEKYGSKKEIKTKTRQFEYRQIVSYLSERFGSEGATMLSAIIPEYSELSSYVHGGPTTVHEGRKGAESRFEEYRGMVRFVVNTHKEHIALVYTALANAGDEDLLEVAKALREISPIE